MTLGKLIEIGDEYINPLWLIRAHPWRGDAGKGFAPGDVRGVVFPGEEFVIHAADVPTFRRVLAPFVCRPPEEETPTVLRPGSMSDLDCPSPAPGVKVEDGFTAG